MCELAKMRSIYLVGVIIVLCSAGPAEVLTETDDDAAATNLDVYDALHVAQLSRFESEIGMEFKHRNYDELTTFLTNTNSMFPNLTSLYSIGQSVEGRELWVMVVSASPREHMLGKPEVKYVANMHGNDAVSREMMLHLIDHLVSGYETDDYIRWLLDNTRIHIEVAKLGECLGQDGRNNARGFDLNRNFPDFFNRNLDPLQPETIAVKKWLKRNKFILSIGFHDDVSIVASYPFDNLPGPPQSGTPNLTPDDDVFKHLALTYSKKHNSMYKGLPCLPDEPSFKDGIINGAEWFTITGGMHDFNYVRHGCMEVTVSISCCSYPLESELSKYWDDNRVPMLKFLGEAHRGVHGFVSDENGNPINRALLKVKGRKFGFRSTKNGEFWRILLPGMYTMKVKATGYKHHEVKFSVYKKHSTNITIILQPEE